VGHEKILKTNRKRVLIVEIAIWRLKKRGTLYYK